MSIAVNKGAFVVSAAQPISLSQMFGVTAASGNPQYLVLTCLDREDYTAGVTDATGTLSGDGATDAFSSIGNDGYCAGIVFTYQADTGRYYNSTYGYFDQLTYNASSSVGDVTNLSLFGMSDLDLANADAGNAYTMMQLDAAGYIGSATVATEPMFSGTVPAQATPDSIAAVAGTFVGDAWNINGCWILASTISAEAGASLPIQSTDVGLPGQANGEWMVAFNGPAGQSGDWQSMVTAGEIIVFGEAGGGGHVTTCVAGSGATAMVIDNAAFRTVEGQITNLANDGSSSDITIAAAHLASLEWTGVQASTVVIYELDTPIVTTSSATASLAGGASCSLGPLFSATDPAARPIVEYQIYDTSATDSLLVNGAVVAAHSAATAATANSLASVFLSAGSVACADTLDVRAFNGSYWGDWQSINFTVSAASSLQVVQAPIISAPQLNSQTPNQNWFQGASVSFTLPTNTFVDPQGQALTYAVRQANGQALPSWLTFDGASETFSGTVPVGATALSLLVSATDQSGLSASETFQVAVPAASPPILANPTSPQAWRAGRQFSLTLPTNTFVDPQNENLSYTATQFNGLPLPRWLSFNPSTKTFSGTAPITPQTLEINVTAIDSSGLSAAEFFSATVLPSNPILTNQTPNQIWQDGGPASFMLPSNTFSDPNGLALTYTAHEMSGPDVTSWLRFNGNTGAFSGNIPTTSSGAISIEVVATNTRNQSASETFGVTFASVPGHLMIGF